MLAWLNVQGHLELVRRLHIIALKVMHSRMHVPIHEQGCACKRAGLWSMCCDIGS